MSNLKFGVFNVNFIREYVTGIFNSVHHYEGQLIISDGNVCGVVDPCFASNQEAVTTSFGSTINIKNFLNNKYKKLASKALKDDTSIDKYTPEDIFFFQHKSFYPITWYETYDEAVENMKPVPENRTIAMSSSLTAEHLSREPLHQTIAIKELNDSNFKGKFNP